MAAAGQSERLKRAQEDAAAFGAEVRAVINAQRDQITLLEKQAQQLANEAAAEQRFNLALVANDKSSKLARLQQEHAMLGADLDAEGHRCICNFLCRPSSMPTTEILEFFAVRYGALQGRQEPLRSFAE